MKSLRICVIEHADYIFDLFFTIRSLRGAREHKRTLIPRKHSRDQLPRYRFLPFNRARKSDMQGSEKSFADLSTRRIALSSYGDMKKLYTNRPGIYGESREKSPFHQ